METAGMVVIILGTIVLVALFGTYAISIVSYIGKEIKNTLNKKHCRANIRDRVKDNKRKREQKDYGKKYRRNREEDNYSANSKNSFSYCDYCIHYSKPVWN